MTTVHKPLPVWILIVSGLFALMELMVSIYLCVAPASMLEGVDSSAKGVDYLIYMWAARQFALGCIFAYATIRRSVPMLTITYIFFLVMFMGDLVIGVTRNESGVIISAIVMCLIAVGMLYAVNRSRSITQP